MIPNQWYGILPSKEVKPEKIVSVLRLNLQLALFRNQKGEIGCVVDQCTHRGAELSVGKVKNGCIQCPFHGLEFRVDGTCSYIPAYGRKTTEDLSRFNVKSYPVKEAHGMIYLWYGEGAPDYKAKLPFFDEYLDDSFAYSQFSDTWNSHYSRCIENQLDVVHLPFVHHNTIGKGNKTIVNGPAVEFENGLLRTSAQNEKDLGQKPKQPEECTIGDGVFLGFRFPNVWMNHIAKQYKLIIFFTPVDDEHTILYIFIYSAFSRFYVVNKMIAYASRLMAYIIERQDRRVVITQKPKPSAYHSKEKLLSGDRPIVIYRKTREELKQAGNAPKD